MNGDVEIPTLGSEFPVVNANYKIIDEMIREIPGSVSYSIKRVAKQPSFNVEDTGMLIYNFEKKSSKNNYIELRFCVAGNSYCNTPEKSCENCAIHNSTQCGSSTETIDFVSFRYQPKYFRQFIKEYSATDRFNEKVLSFNHKNSFSKSLPLCGKTRNVLESLLNNNFSGVKQNIFINAQAQILLLYGMECMLGEKEDLQFTCKFLANEEGREKIMLAREILLKHIGEPITIKSLSKKVAINECYLKKGFKEVFGTTIFDFYHNQRMEHAKYLLYEKGLNVTEVSSLLGYSSISHFSTAFKKHTGLKPCELLFR